jgi:hypothetical protein
VALVDQVIVLLRQRGRLTYRTLQLQFQLDEAHLEVLKDEIIYGQRMAVDEDGRVLVWTGDAGTASVTASAPAGTAAWTPLTSTPSHLTELVADHERERQGSNRGDQALARRGARFHAMTLWEPRCMGALRYTVGRCTHWACSSRKPLSICSCISRSGRHRLRRVTRGVRGTKTTA